jgi:hypothetical protein
MASVDDVPGATFVICRSYPAWPTETVLSRSARESAPSATALAAFATAPLPNALEPAPLAGDATDSAVDCLSIGACYALWRFS